MTAYPATIADVVEHELVIKKSRFLAHVAPVAGPEEADAVIASVKKQFWGARHNCSAQVTGLLGDRARSSDDGEPSGTAGRDRLPSWSATSRSLSTAVLPGRSRGRRMSAA